MSGKANNAADETMYVTLLQTGLKNHNNRKKETKEI
jgi:hypothetical protein